MGIFTSKPSNVDKEAGKNRLGQAKIKRDAQRDPLGKMKLIAGAGGWESKNSEKTQVRAQNELSRMTGKPIVSRQVGSEKISANGEH